MQLQSQKKKTMWAQFWFRNTVYLLLALVTIRMQLNSFLIKLMEVKFALELPYHINLPS
jgi:hypothetical protein